MEKLLNLLLFFTLLIGVQAQLSGNIYSINDVPPTTDLLKQTVVVAIKNFYNTTTKEPHTLTYDQIYRFQAYDHVYGTVDTSGHFEVNNLDTAPDSYYSLFLFVDENQDQHWNTDTFEPCGWNLLPDVTPQPIPTLSTDQTVWNITLNSGMNFTEDDINSVANGAFGFVKGYPVLHTWGSPTDRAYAHGFLLAKQIVHLLRFWLLESTVRDYDYYNNAVIPFLKTPVVVIPQQAHDEMHATFNGMVDSGANLFVPELNRNFTYEDVVYINNYGVQPPPIPLSSSREYSREHAPRFRSTHCSQFSAWGDRTGDVGTIAARNMDDELDIRKTTVSLFVMMAVQPTNGSGELAYVNYGWPGFVSAMTSGFNEKGLHAMLNSGFDWQPGPPPKSLRAGMILNNVLSTMNCATIADTMNVLPFEKEEIPSFLVGVNILLAQPDTVEDGTAPSVVYEGDRKGGLFRYEKEASPYLNEFLLTTNHFLKYGYDLEEPYSNFGEPVSMSSWWRYIAGGNYLLALDSFQTQVQGREMERALENVCHGTSEHSVVTFSNQLQFKVGIASMKYSNFYSSYELIDAPLFDFWDVFFAKH
eukprot:CAMPEP_0201510434 /NCGR_PEP_ID=MMETSP0161_2-20130828/3124_1 /ASSEMBLY_ACC=CAM_ASM_000251 /TAXON_ID=180227 /ORGANISM="Neoparamoeba aestuarina, Strain SoJaBio B1-5/56/2" /LENGTH=585 /DNA_ID=CAMNT_0047905605 /DNA_START=61 /DNA_END=1818 /DNA_ORIENTATION=-